MGSERERERGWGEDCGGREIDFGGGSGDRCGVCDVLGWEEEWGWEGIGGGVDDGGGSDDGRVGDYVKRKRDEKDG